MHDSFYLNMHDSFYLNKHGSVYFQAQKECEVMWLVGVIWLAMADNPDVKVSCA